MVRMNKLYFLVAVLILSACAPAATATQSPVDSITSQAKPELPFQPTPEPIILTSINHTFDGDDVVITVDENFELVIEKFITGGRRCPSHRPFQNVSILVGDTSMYEVSLKNGIMTFISETAVPGVTDQTHPKGTAFDLLTIYEGAEVGFERITNCGTFIMVWDEFEDNFAPNVTTMNLEPSQIGEFGTDEGWTNVSGEGATIVTVLNGENFTYEVYVNSSNLTVTFKGALDVVLPPLEEVVRVSYPDNIDLYAYFEGESWFVAPYVPWSYNEGSLSGDFQGVDFASVSDKDCPNFTSRDEFTMILYLTIADRKIIKVTGYTDPASISLSGDWTEDQIARFGGLGLQVGQTMTVHSTDGDMSMVYCGIEDLRGK